MSSTTPPPHPKSLGQRHLEAFQRSNSLREGLQSAAAPAPALSAQPQFDFTSEAVAFATSAPGSPYRLAGDQDAAATPPAQLSPRTPPSPQPKPSQCWKHMCCVLCICSVLVGLFVADAQYNCYQDSRQCAHTKANYTQCTACVESFANRSNSKTSPGRWLRKLGGLCARPPPTPWDYCEPAISNCRLRALAPPPLLLHTTTPTPPTDS